MSRDHDTSDDTVTGAEKPLFSRRSLLAYGAAAGLAVPGGMLAREAFARNFGPAAAIIDESAICRTPINAAAAAPGAPLRPIKLAWNASAICTASAPVAQDFGIFKKHGLEVEFINFGGSTEQLLEAIATGKADAGIGMALRWLKPLEQGFDVRITTGVHGGCLRLLGSPAAGVTKLEDLKGKAVAIADQAGPAKNFFALLLAKRGIDPFKDVEWRQYPIDLLPLAIEKGEAAALADSDPRTWLFLRDSKGKLTEVATNLTAEFATRSCCVLAVRGSLIRNDKAVAAALTRAVLEGGHHVATHPEDAAKAFAGYGGKGSIEDLAQMLREQTHHHHPIGPDLKKEIAAYADELKIVQVLKPTTDSARFADRVYADVLT